MQRTIVSLSDQDHAWLNKQAAAQHLSKTELVRRAIGVYRKNFAAQQKMDLSTALEKTQGITKLKDGLKYQQELRNEWSR